MLVLLFSPTQANDKNELKCLLPPIAPNQMSIKAKRGSFEIQLGIANKVRWREAAHEYNQEIKHTAVGSSQPGCSMSMRFTLEFSKLCALCSVFRTVYFVLCAIFSVV